MKPTIYVIVISVWISLIDPVLAATKNSTSAMQVDNKQVNSWNLFTEQLYILHQHQVSQHDTIQKISTGGYFGSKD